ncbi:hypothetical protein CBL_21030, partial [Carabus blaptoides fortunei]
MEFKPPRGLNIEGDVSQNWKDFKQKFDIFLEANEYTNRTDAIKIAMLLNCIGDGDLALYNTFKINENEGAKYDSVMKALADFFNKVELNKDNNVDEWYHNISINNVSILFKLDIGADVNVMPYNIYEKLCSVTQLQPTESKIFKYGGAQ